MNTNLILIAVGLIASFAAFNVYAIESQGKWIQSVYVRTAEYRSAAFDDPDRGRTLPGKKAVLRHTFMQSPTDRQNEFFIELCVYIVIIMIYSFYGLKQY